MKRDKYIKILALSVITLSVVLCVGYIIYKHYENKRINKFVEDQILRIDGEVNELKDIEQNTLYESNLHWHYYERISELEKKRNTRFDFSELHNGSTILVSSGDTLYYFSKVHSSVGYDYSIKTDSSVLVESYHKYNKPEEQYPLNCGGDAGEKITSIIPLKNGKFKIKICHRFRDEIKSELTYNIEVKGESKGLANKYADSQFPNIWEYISNLQTADYIQYLEGLGISSIKNGKAVSVIDLDSAFIQNSINQLIPARTERMLLDEKDWIIYKYSHKTESGSIQILSICYSKRPYYPYIVITFYEDKPKTTL